MPTALVTGASSGIAADFARELACDGYDVVLAARRMEPMQKLAAELATKTTTISCDLSRPGAAAELARELEVRGISIDVLINNAGLGGTGRFDQMDAGRISEMLPVNVVALTEWTRLLLPLMIARRRGRVLLVGSTAGFMPGPAMVPRAVDRTRWAAAVGGKTPSRAFRGVRGFTEAVPKRSVIR